MSCSVALLVQSKRGVSCSRGVSMSTSAFTRSLPSSSQTYQRTPIDLDIVDEQDRACGVLLVPHTAGDLPTPIRAIEQPLSPSADIARLHARPSRFERFTRHIISLQERYFFHSSPHKRDGMQVIPRVDPSSHPGTESASQSVRSTSSMLSSSVSSFPTVTSMPESSTLSSSSTANNTLISSTESVSTSSTGVSSSTYSSSSIFATTISSYASYTRSPRSSTSFSTSNPTISSELPPSSRESSTIYMSFSSRMTLSSLQTSVVTQTRSPSVFPPMPHTHLTDYPTSSVEPGVLSTNTSKGPDGFARNTAAIIGVAIAGAIFIIFVVIATFLLCRRYRGRHIAPGASSFDALNYAAWQSPLAGDDDQQYYSDMHYGMLTASSQRQGTSRTHINDVESDHTEPLSMVHGTSSSEYGFSRPTRNMSFGQGSSSVDDYAANASSYYPSYAHTPSLLPPSSWQGIRDGTWVLARDGEANSSMSSVNVGTSSHGHNATSTSSGHGLLLSKPKPSSRLENVGGFLSRLRSARTSPPDIVVHGARSKPSLSESFFRPKKSLAQLPVQRSVSSQDPPGDPWEATNVLSRVGDIDVDLGMSDDLLTPNLAIASTEHSSSASLRDHVDYSRPIGGLVRNRVHSAPTYRTEGTVTTIDGKETSSIASARDL